MKHLDRNVGQLAWLFFREPDSFLETLEELLTALESFEIGDERIEVGFEGDEDFWICDFTEGLLLDIEKALQISRRHCHLVRRYCEEVDNGRGPSMKVGIRLLRSVREGEKPTEATVTEWRNWYSELQDFIDLFMESLIVDSLIEEDGRLIPEDRSENASTPDDMADADGVAVAVTQQRIENPADDAKPTWRRNERTLLFNGEVVRKFAPQTRKAVLDIVTAFEECGWPNRIDDPLCPPDGEKTKLALRTINNGLVGVRFKKDGDGILWEVISNSP